MGKMLHNEARELLVESYEKTHNAEEIAKIFGVNKYTVYHCLKQSPVRFCASVNGIALGGLRSVDIACNFGDCYNQIRVGNFSVRLRWTAPTQCLLTCVPGSILGYIECYCFVHLQ